VRLPLITPSVKARSVYLTAHERVNLYPEESGVDENGRPSYSLIGTPGLSLFTTLPNSPVRGLIQSANGTFVAVGGNTVYTVSTAGTATSIGTIGTTDGVVRMADNGTQIMIVDGNRAYYSDLSTVTEITDLTTIITNNSYDGPEWCTAQDGYMIIAFPNSDDFYISGSDDASSWSSLDFSSADARPGYIKAIISHLDELWILKDKSFEVWYNSGASFPFERHQGAEGEVGCAALGSVERIGNSLLWLGGNEQGEGQVFMTQGYSVIPVSGYDMPYIFNSFSTLTDAPAWTYQQEGHVFQCFDFQASNQSWAYDITTKLWHRRAYLNASTNASERQRGHVQAHFNGKDYVGDYFTGQIFQLDLDTYTDNGQEIQRKWVGPHVRNRLKRLFIRSFQLGMESGIGINTGQGSDPQAMLEFSKDRGHTWSDNEYWADIGKQGAYNARVKWWQLGSALDTWTPRVTISDPIKVVIQDAEVNG